MIEQQTGRAGQIDRRAIPDAARESWWNAPDGQAIRRIDWRVDEGGARGSLLFVPGRADFYEKYLESLAHWHARGWNVTAIDWRGQAFSGRLAKDGSTGHVPDYGIWVRDLADFWNAWAASGPAPKVIAAHSMGGHIVVRALAESRIAPDAVVLTAPMLGLKPDFVPRGLLHLAARLMVRLRGSECPAWSGSEKPGRMPEDREDLLTHDDARFADEIWWRRERPELALGPPSWGWIERSLASIALLARPGMLERIRTPVLAIATTADELVSYGAVARAVRRLPTGELMTLGEEARHELLREVDAVRDPVIARIDAFLDRAAPPRPGETA